VLPAPADLVGEARPIPDQATEASKCEGQPFTLITQGGTFTADGAPVPGAPIAVGDPEGEHAVVRTDDKGKYQVTLEHADWVSPADARGTPPSICVAIPNNIKIVPPNGAPMRMFMRENNFIVPAHCPFSLTVDPKMTWPATLYAHNGEEVFVLDALAAPPTAPLQLPCDTPGVMLLSADQVAGDEGCAVGAGFACTDAPHTATLRARPATSWSATVVDPSGAPLAGVRVSTRWGTHETNAEGLVTLTVPTADAPVDLARGGFVARHLPALPDGPVTLQPARRVEVRCAGAVDDRCQLVPWSRPADAPDAEATPCALVGSLGAVCDVPAQGDAVLLGGGRATLLPASREVGWIDLRALRGGIKGQLTAPDGAPPTACVWRATRSIGWLDDLRAASSPDSARTRVLSGRCRDGRFEATALSPGGWTVEVYVPGERRLTREVTVADSVVDLGAL
jgi:hypothetical protein